MMDTRIIEDGFWISDKNNKNDIGMKIIPIYDNRDKIESVEILTIDPRSHNNIIAGETVIYKEEFRKLIQFADLLREEMVQ